MHTPISENTIHTVKDLSIYKGLKPIISKSLQYNRDFENYRKNNTGTNKSLQSRDLGFAMSPLLYTATGATLGALSKLVYNKIKGTTGGYGVSAVGGALGGYLTSSTSNIIGGLLALFTKRRSLKEQLTVDNSRSAVDALVNPGGFVYNAFKRRGALENYKLSDKQNKTLGSPTGFIRSINDFNI